MEDQEPVVQPTSPEPEVPTQTPDAVLAVSSAEATLPADSPSRDPHPAEPEAAILTEAEESAEPSDSIAPETDRSEATAELAPDAASLAELAERSVAQRLPAPEEQKASRLVEAGLLAGKDDLLAVAAVLPKLGWAVAVKGVTAAWPNLKTTARTTLLKLLSADETEGGRRIRLSIARGLFKVPDLPTVLKLVVAVCKEMRDKETGQIPPRDAVNFANVLIGKGKPWIAQLPLGDLKPADAALVVHCTIISSFAVGGPPVTPLGVLKWAGEAGQLTEIHEAALNTIIQGVSRWSAKWANVLRKEVPNAPEAVLAALKPAAAPASEPPAIAVPPTIGEDGLPLELREPSERGDELEDGSPADAREDDAGGNPVDLDDDDDDEEEDDEERGLEEAGEAPKPKERPVYVSKTVPPRQGQQQPAAPAQREVRGSSAKSTQFNAADALRQLESHINWLKGELQSAEKRLRSRDEERRQRPRLDTPVIPGEPTPEELARLNVQLENRIVELQARIDDLTQDAETRATSQGAFADGPAPEPALQLRTLLGLKLKDHYADFLALEQQDRDLVIPQHYRSVLAEVFEVLKTEQIPLISE